MQPPSYLPLIALLAACVAPTPPSNRPSVNLAPLDCGYRWFQTGYSEYLPIACDADRSHLKAEQTALAEEHAWQVARTRCPGVCPPVLLKDTVAWQNPEADGVCRDNRVYYLTRQFFACVKP